MKLAVFLVVVLPLAISAPSKERAFSFNPLLQSMMHVFHADEIEKLVTGLVDDIGTDARKAECNEECDKLVDVQVAKSPVNTITHTVCPTVCTSLQELAHMLHVPIPSSSAATY